MYVLTGLLFLSISGNALALKNERYRPNLDGIVPPPPLDLSLIPEYRPHSSPKEENFVSWWPTSNPYNPKSEWRKNRPAKKNSFKSSTNFPPVSDKDVVWFPIDDIKGGYTSSLGELYVGSDTTDWDDQNTGERRFRSVFRGDTPDSSSNIVFPGYPEYIDTREEEKAVDFDECMRSCPKTREYNPICGSDRVTYHSASVLNCVNLCGKEVRYIHPGYCGKGLPLIFRPGPRPARSG